MSFRPESNIYKYWTKEEDEKITELVNQATPLKEIAIMMSRSYTSCAGRSSLLGLYNKYTGPSKHSVNELFWDTPNELNCYYAGALAADGCIQLNNKRFEYSGVLSWETHVSDKIILDSFKENTGYTGEVQTFTRKGGFLHSALRIYSPVWNKNLIEKFNIVPKKTFRTYPPNDISESLLFCWLIGYIDGDGTIFLDKNKNTFAIKVTSSSEKLVFWIYNFLKERFKQQLRNKPVSIPRKLKYANCWEISVCGTRAFCLYAYLRQYNLPKLKRKWEKPKIIELENKYKIKYPHFFDFSHLPSPI